ncbi:NERD domain-containing protein [Streptomyces sp. NPDC008150]|uniref:NERD domain-containing protein n=1 Tax=Streptomyces sp. NPDC008150 TaxID=3364816 RepID=UPI0036EE5785
MSTAGASAFRQAAAIRAAARKGPWRRLLAALGWSAVARRADQEAARWELGGRAEMETARILAPLEAQGWLVLHDRALPRSRANVDHVAVAPGGVGVVVLDTKRWHAGFPTGLVGGRLCCGTRPKDREAVAVVGYADRIAALAGLPAGVVAPVLVIHGSPVVGGAFMVRAAGREVLVVGAECLVPVLAGSVPARGGWGSVSLAGRLEELLPVYR